MPKIIKDIIARMALIRKDKLNIKEIITVFPTKIQPAKRYEQKIVNNITNSFFIFIIFLP